MQLRLSPLLVCTAAALLATCGARERPAPRGLLVFEPAETLLVPTGGLPYRQLYKSFTRLYTDGPDTVLQLFDVAGRNLVFYHFATRAAVRHCFAHLFPPGREGIGDCLRLGPDSILIATSFFYFDGRLADSTLILYVPSRSEFRPLPFHSPHFHFSGDLAPPDPADRASLDFYHSRLSPCSAGVCIGVGPAWHGKWAPKNGGFQFVGVFGRLFEPGLATLGLVGPRHHFVDSLPWYPSEANSPYLWFEGGGDVYISYAHKPNVFRYSLRNGDLQAGAAPSALQAAVAPDPGRGPTFLNQGHAKPGEFQYAGLVVRPAANEALALVKHAAAPQAEPLMAGLPVYGAVLTRLDSLAPVAEGILPPLPAYAPLVFPAADGYFVVDDALSRRLGDTLALVRYRVRLEPCADLAGALRAEWLRRGRFPLALPEAVWQAAGLEVGGRPFLLFDPNFVCGSCFAAEAPALDSTAAFALPVVASFARAPASPAVRALVARCHQDTSGVLAAQLLPQSGFHYFRFDSLAGLWHREPVDWHRLGALLRGG
jgi:hypothetical protein